MDDMTDSFINALQTKDTVTENGMPTNSTSGSYVLDMFFKLGGARELPLKEIINIFVMAMNEDPTLAMRCAFYNRDIRGGQGERRSFRMVFTYMCIGFSYLARKNLHNVPFYGRWDDLLYAIGTPVERDALDLIAHALKSGDMLCAKWMPREGKSMSKQATILRKYMGLSPKQYRKLLAGNTSVVENFMCKNDWSKINYNTVPSVASTKYRKAFHKHDHERYASWLESLSKPESGNRIHSEVSYPHTLVNAYIRDGIGRAKTDATLEEQWKALPDYIPEGKSFIPVCDLSGSMVGEPMCVSASLGLYLAERNKGPFKDAFITFSRIPKLQVVRGSLLERLLQMNLSLIAENTDLERVFTLILSKAKESHLDPKDLPQTILIISDMQFDSCIYNSENSAIEMIRRQYREAGYEIPNVVFWNVSTREGVPVKVTDSGVALVSGFSPSIMKGLLSGDITPRNVMLKTLLDPRYERVVI